jgi:hypothetical protein
MVKKVQWTCLVLDQTSPKKSLEPGERNRQVQQTGLGPEQVQLD